MKVCLLTHTFPRFSKDTAAPFMHGVAEGLTVAGNEVFVLTPFSSKFTKDWVKNRRYKIVTYRYTFPSSFHKLGYSETLSNDKSLKLTAYLLAPFMYFFGVIALLRLVRKEKIDVINAHWILPNGFIAACVSKITGVPVISTLPGSDVYMAGSNALFRSMATFAAKNSRFITSNSLQLIDDLKNITKISEDKYREIIYGVNPGKFLPGRNLNLRRQLKIRDKEIVVLGVGRLVSKKGFKYLIEASKDVLRKNCEVKFVLIGDGDEKLALINLAKKLEVYNSFFFLGNIAYTSLPDYYRMADIFILPSVRDEKGNLDDQSVSVVEAMSSGLPVVTSDLPGYRLVIQNSVDGYLLGQKNSRQISDTLNRLISSPGLREKIGREARNSALTRFSWKNIGKLYSGIFAEALMGDSYSKNIPAILNKSERIRIAKQIYTVVSHHLGSTEKLACLDIGCSSGVITNYLAGRFAHVTGVDIDKEALLLARKNYPMGNIAFKEMKAEKLDFKDESFDVIIANQIYEFVSDDEQAFKEIHRVLKSHGICFVGARNKFAIIEAQYHLPFISWLPKMWSDNIIRLLGKGNKFVGKYRSYPELRALVAKFKLYDYTGDIIKNPLRYGYTKLAKYSFLLRFLPISLLKPLFPNYIWVIEK